MTDEIVYAKDFGPNVASVVDAVTAIWPLHTDFMRSSLAAHDAQNRPVLEKLAADIVQLCGADLGDDVMQYRRMCEAFLEEELYFRRNDSYRCTSLEEAKRHVYDDADFMHMYMKGLLISQLLWNNHAKAMSAFSNSFLPSLAAGTKVLEVGPGHGLFMSRMLRDHDALEVYGWDISKQSLEMTHASLKTLGLVDGYHLQQRDVLASDDDVPTFDAVIISEVLEHLERPLEALTSLRRRLNPGGRIFINIPINSPAPDHIYLIREPEGVWQMTKDAGLEIFETYTFPMTGYTYERAIKNVATITCIAIARVA